MRRSQTYLAAFALGMALVAMACGRFTSTSSKSQPSPTPLLLIPTSTATLPLTPLTPTAWATNTPGPSPTPTLLPHEYIATPYNLGWDNQILRLGRGDIQAMDLAPDGQYLAVATSIGLYWYAADTFEQVWFYPTDHPIGCVAIAPGGQTVAFCLQQTVRILRTTHGGVSDSWVMPEDKNITSIHWSPDGAQMSIGTVSYQSEGVYDRSVSIVDTRTREQMHLFHDWEDAIWSPDGLAMALLGEQRMMVIGTQTGRERFTVPTCCDIAWSPDAKMIFTAGESGGQYNTVRDAETGDILISAAGILWAPVVFAWSPDGRVIAGSEESTSTLVMWDARTGQQFHTVLAGSGGVHSLEFSPDGHTLYSASHSTVIRWDVQSGEINQVLRGHLQGRVVLEPYITSVAWSPDGNIVAIGTDTGSIMFWDTPSQTFNEPSASAPRNPGLRWSLDGEHLFVAGRSLEHTAWILDANTHEKTYQVNDPGSCPFEWSPGGEYYVHCAVPGTSVSAIRMHNTQTGNMIWERESRNYPNIAWSPDGQILAVGTQGRIELLSARTGQTLYDLTQQAAFHHISWSADSRQFVAETTDGALYLWNARSGQLLQKLGVNGFWAVLSPDGTMVAIARRDNSIDLLSRTTWLTQQTLVGHTDRIGDMAWSPDSSMLVSASEDGTVIFWRVER